MTAAGMHFPYAVGILILRGMNNMDGDPLTGFHRQQGIVVLSCVTRIEKSKPNVLHFSLHYTSSPSSHAIRWQGGLLAGTRCPNRAPLKLFL
jgi:hypothetical protein